MWTQHADMTGSPVDALDTKAPVSFLGSHTWSTLLRLWLSERSTLRGRHGETAESTHLDSLDSASRAFSFADFSQYPFSVVSCNHKSSSCSESRESFSQLSSQGRAR